MTRIVVALVLDVPDDIAESFERYEVTAYQWICEQVDSQHARVKGWNFPQCHVMGCPHPGEWIEKDTGAVVCRGHGGDWKDYPLHQRPLDRPWPPKVTL